jgi:hypothetical protein
MVDNKRKRGKADRRKVARKQAYEIKHVAKKFGVAQWVVRAIVRIVGNNRNMVEASVEIYKEERDRAHL